MLIDRIRFKNFLVFGGDQEMRFDFRDGRNVTVVLAPNNAGKTSIIRSLRFLLYGVADERTGIDLLPNIWAVSEAKVGKVETSFVEATVREGDRRMTLQRKIRWERTDNPKKPIHIVQEGGHVTHHEPERDRIVHLPEAQDTFSILVPQSMFDFFFFKGEELAGQLLRARPDEDVLAEVNKLLYKEEFEDLVDTFVSARQKLGRKLKQTEQAQKEYHAALERRDALKRANEAAEAELRRLRKEEQHTSENLEAADARLRGMDAANNPERKRRLEELGRRISGLESERSRIQADRMRVLGKDFVWILLARRLDRARQTLEVLRSRRALPPDISEGLLGQILEEKRCICGRPCVEESAEWHELSRLRRVSLSESLSTELWTIHNKLSPGDRLGYLAAASAHRNALSELGRRESEKVVELRQNKTEYDRLEPLVNEKLEGQYREARRERENVRVRLDGLRRQIQEKEHELRSLTQNLRNAQADSRIKVGDASTDGLTVAARMCDQLAQTAKACHEEITHTIQHSLQRDLSDLYASVVTDGSTARIEHATLLPKIRRSDRSGYATGGGQQQTLILCYLIALARLRREINQGITRTFGIPAFREQAFFMDSVFGQMQDEYRKRVAAVLPKELPQLVLLLAGQQWSAAVQEGIGDELTNAYGLELWTPKSVDKKEFCYRFGGKEIRLHQQLKPGEEPRTTLRRLV